MLDGASKIWKIVVVPGGGPFADQVRLQDKRLGLSAKASHRMAILAMDQFGLLLCDLLKNAAATTTLRMAINFAGRRQLPVILPSRFPSALSSLRVSWDVTSDTIAACLAGHLRARRLILVTDVDGLFTKNPKKNPDAKLIRRISLEELSRSSTRTCVDKALPSQLRNSRLDTWILNGLQPERFDLLMRGETPISTRIIV
jgi:aspartokinase-like uncharacterized kinase